ncbi:hypothetical protein BBD42_05750 [Paenibacillus sp. BIHB 4019]|uniref:Ferric siderophore reductase C-terminal domain-containing protein n=2 Tax=Paenibacillus sp. BIHB 4019 TaxID=1870819 RepID=A0A1B2DE90_9BACL|nr:hypothetical protein BBD42_05750 [Paenibacillus sp. BIHB 4019]
MNRAMWEQLERHFGIESEPGKDLGKEAVMSIKGEDLIDVAAMSGFLAAYNQLIEGMDEGVAAAYFSSWFGSVIAALHYSISVYDTAPNFSLSNLEVQLIKEPGFTKVGFRVERKEAEQAPDDLAGRQRQQWLEHVLFHFYRNTAHPLMESLAQASSLNIGLLWGQLPTALNNYRERLQQSITDEAVLKQLEADERFVQALPSEWFGRSKNPFHVNVRYIPNPLDPEKQLALKNVCCLQFRRKNRSYCYTCPRLTRQQRAEWKI